MNFVILTLLFVPKNSSSSAIGLSTCYTPLTRTSCPAHHPHQTRHLRSPASFCLYVAAWVGLGLGPDERDSGLATDDVESPETIRFGSCIEAVKDVKRSSPSLYFVHTLLGCTVKVLSLYITRSKHAFYVRSGYS